MRSHQGHEHQGHAHGRGATRAHPHGHEPEPSRQSRLESARLHHQSTYWVYCLLIVLGAWLASSPWTFGYDAGPMMWSDLASGIALVVLGWLALKPHRPLVLWLACAVGVWLQFAPLLIWAQSPAAYLNDTLVGALVIALTILIPDMPGMVMVMHPGPQIPPGWTYNPSSWPQRAVMIALGFAGWLVSRYLAAYQLGYIDRVWEPFFGPGSRRVLESEMSHAWPISDAGLGAVSYTFEMLMGFMGCTARWRTMPWMVLFFGILIVPLGLTHIVLVISQPVIVGEWCTLCLLAAAIMLPMIPLTVDEVVAMGQFMRQKVRRGEGFWRTFWLGGTVEGGAPDDRSPQMTAGTRRVLPAMLWGVSVPWTLVASTLLGLWLLFEPAALGQEAPAAHSSRITGGLVITIAVIAMAEVVRAARLLNIIAGLWLIAGPWLLWGGRGPSDAMIASNLLAGIALIVLSLPRGPVRERYGAWDGLIR